MSSTEAQNPRTGGRRFGGHAPAAVGGASPRDPGLEVAGYAANGRIALALLDQVAPDIVTLDVEMPVMDGLATLQALRERPPHLPVIMFSTLTERGAEATIDALALGASDYVAKPAGRGRLQRGARPHSRRVAAEDQSAVPQASGCSVAAAFGPAAALHAVHSETSPEPVSVVAIGCSTGGPNALAQVLPRSPHGLSRCRS